jgi:hypothetical protein
VTEEPEQPQAEPEDAEVVDGLPVLSSDDAHTAIEPAAAGGALLPSRQVAALAATGFVAGAATIAIVHRRRAKPVRRRKKPNRIGFGEVVASNSFLVDVHLLRRD